MSSISHISKFWVLFERRLRQKIATGQVSSTLKNDNSFDTSLIFSVIKHLNRFFVYLTPIWYIFEISRSVISVKNIKNLFFDLWWRHVILKLHQLVQLYITWHKSVWDMSKNSNPFGNVWELHFGKNQEDFF